MEAPGTVQAVDWINVIAGAGNTVVPVTVNAGDPGGFLDDLAAAGLTLSSFDQVWDMRVNDIAGGAEELISASDSTALNSYLAGGGRVVLFGEHEFFTNRDDPLRNYLSSQISTSGGYGSAILTGSSSLLLNVAGAAASDSFNTDYNVLGAVGACAPGAVPAGTFGSGTSLYDSSSGGSVVQAFAGGQIQASRAAGRVVAIWDTNIANPSCGGVGYTNSEFVLNVVDYLAGPGLCSGALTLSRTSTRTPTPTPTSSTTRTATPSRTASASPTVSASYTPSPTISPTSTITPTPGPYVLTLSRNAFRPANQELVRIGFYGPVSGRYRLTIYNSAGELVRRLQDTSQVPGPPAYVTWDGTNQYGIKVAAGVYILRAESPQFAETRRLVLLR